MAFYLVALHRPCTSLAAALTLHHRFRKFLVQPSTPNAEDLHIARRIDPHLVAIVCVNLALKTTEIPRKVRDIINVTYVLLHPDQDYFHIDDVRPP